MSLGLSLNEDVSLWGGFDKPAHAEPQRERQRKSALLADKVRINPSPCLKPPFSDEIFIFNKIPFKFTDELNSSFSKQQFRIFSGMSDVWEYKENNAKSLAYQELALVSISATKDVSDSDVIDEAKKLRDKNEKAGEWKSLRNLEDRYKLKPLPRNPTEK
jgi:hypothetical protein